MISQAHRCPSSRVGWCTWGFYHVPFHQEQVMQSVVSSMTHLALQHGLRLRTCLGDVPTVNGPDTPDVGCSCHHGEHQQSSGGSLHIPGIHQPRLCCWKAKTQLLAHRLQMPLHSPKTGRIFHNARTTSLADVAGRTYKLALHSPVVAAAAASGWPSPWLCQASR